MSQERSFRDIRVGVQASAENKELEITRPCDEIRIDVGMAPRLALDDVGDGKLASLRLHLIWSRYSIALRDRLRDPRYAHT